MELRQLILTLLTDQICLQSQRQLCIILQKAYYKSTVEKWAYDHIISKKVTNLTDEKYLREIYSILQPSKSKEQLATKSSGLGQY